MYVLFVWKGKHSLAVGIWVEQCSDHSWNLVFTRPFAEVLSHITFWVLMYNRFVVLEVRSQTFLSVSTFIRTSANEQIMYTYITNSCLIHLLLLKFVGKLSSVGYEYLHKRKKFYVCPVACIDSVTTAIMPVRFLIQWCCGINTQTWLLRTAKATCYSWHCFHNSFIFLLYWKCVQ